MNLNTGKKYKKQLPLSDEQQTQIGKWYRFALKVAYDRRRAFHDEDQIISVVHDSLIRAVRYHDSNRIKEFQCFLVWIIVRGLFQSHKRRTKTGAAKLREITFQFPEYFDCPIAARPQASELVTEKDLLTNLRLQLTPAQQLTISQVFDRGLSDQDAAAERGISRSAINMSRRRALAKMRAAAEARS